MNNKKVVRLTESQLHDIIAESVNQVLMELDPRTYANAADKAFNKSQSRARKFQGAAVDAWNRDYGKKPSIELDYIKDDGTPIFGSVEDEIKMDKYDNPYQVYSDTEDGGFTHYFPFNNDLNDNGEFRKATTKDLKKNKGWRVAREMSKGNGKYIKGKGWQ